MMTKQAANLIFGALLMIGIIPSQAGTMGDISAPNAWYKHVEVSAAGGVNWFNTKNTSLEISPYEVDSDVAVNQVSNNGTWKVGVGYYLFEDMLAERAYLNHLLFEVNVYQITGSINGDVLQYQTTQFNNYSFNAPFTSTRLMFDFKPSLYSWQHVSLYPILGIGVTWNKLSYHETITGTDVIADSQLTLGAHTKTQVAGDVGVGVAAMLTEHLTGFAEYVYGFLGNSSPAGSSANGVPLMSAPSFSFQTQSLLFGLSLKL